MKHRIKKILTTIGALILSVFMFAGCNLIEVNNAKYYKMLENDRFTNASKSEIQTGDHVYFLYEASEIQIIIIMQ